MNRKACVVLLLLAGAAIAGLICLRWRPLDSTNVMRPGVEGAGPLRDRPSTSAEHIQRGMTLEAEGRPDDAQASYKKAIELDSSQAAERMRELCGLEDAEALELRGDMQEAERALREKLAREPQDATAHQTLAGVLWARGKYAASWREVRLCEEHGGALDPGFMRALRAKGSEPDDR